MSSGGVSALWTGRSFLARHRDRLESERVAVHDHDEEAANNEEEGSFINNSTNSTGASALRQSEESQPEQEPSGVESDIEEGDGTRETNPDPDSEEGGAAAVEDETEGINRYAVRPTMTLAELEEERELARRRSSACVLFALFVLFRLWVLALQDGDFGLLLLCLVGTSWTARWIRYNRDQEEELDRRIASYLENNNAENRNEVGRDDLRMLSFQAQLALAIMESQRQMMQGGYGNSEGSQSPGVSEEAKAVWKKFSYKAARDKTESRRGSYGSVAQEDNNKVGDGLSDEEPHCSICLGEYEEGEELIKLPCVSRICCRSAKCDFS